jgi:hypothetical protein
MAAKGSRVNTAGRYANAVTGIPLGTAFGTRLGTASAPFAAGGTANLWRFGVPS